VAVLPSVDWTPVTMRRGTVAGMTALLDWVTAGSVRRVSIGMFETTIGGTVPRSREAVRWVVERAVPVRLEAPSFDATTNDVAIETLEISATDIRVEHL
jgi:phage tail-like protein